ncbi:MAG: hypothetical protein PHV37_01590 [Candidatus Gastranaerophilales bacterium]|nr:hypothetical protein [Candidatus Gastranaerophilales bacterium]
MTEQETDNKTISANKSFEFTFLSLWIIFFVVLFVATLVISPNLFFDLSSIIAILIKMIFIGILSLVFPYLSKFIKQKELEQNSEISKGNWFKVNYAQHLLNLSVYLTVLSTICISEALLIARLWEILFTLIVFVAVTKAVDKYRIKTEKNILDSNIDTRHNLIWNLIPGLILSIVFQNLFTNVLNQPKLVFLIVFIVILGRMFVEVSSIILGRKKYIFPAWNFKQSNIRTFSGSLLFFIITFITVLIFCSDFGSFVQFIITLIVLPIVMTLSEAMLSITKKVPFLLMIGYCTLFLIGIATRSISYAFTSTLLY